MSLMGKIFTLLIFFMSICFLVISIMVGGSHRNWKEIATTMQNQAKAAQNRMQDAKSNTDEKEKILAAERVSRAFQLAQLESQLKRATEDFKAKEAQYRKAIEVSQAQLAELEQVNARIKQQDVKIADLESNSLKLVDDISTQFSNVANLTNETYELKSQIRLLETQKGDINAKLSKSTRVLKNNGLTMTDLTDHIVPKLDGVVSKVGDGFFAVKLGTDDGIRINHVMDIYRLNRFIGKGTVVRTAEDLCVLQIQPDFMKDSVREGDHVTSKL